MVHLESALLLNMVPEIGPIRFKSLQERFSDLSQVFSSSVNELRSVDGISDVLARSILSYGNQRALVEKELKLAASNGIVTLTCDDPRYPQLLKTIIDPPPLLYCKGNVELLDGLSIALVGTRRPTPYGERVAGILSKALSELGITTVSGLARGIDTIIHLMTVQTKGKTIAVLGSGLLKIYPPENKKLAEMIEENGVVVSEFPLQFPPDAGHFPRRNRIIAGLSLGTVVIESSEKSGALITARLAAEQGKDIFAVPGPVTSKMSRGPHQLIRQGAKLVENVLDILEEIEPLKEKICFHFKKSKMNDQQTEKNISSLSTQEKSLFDLIHLEPIPIDLLSSQSHLALGELSQILLALEMKGLIRSLPGKRYVRN